MRKKQDLTGQPAFLDSTRAGKRAEENLRDSFSRHSVGTRICAVND